MDTIIEANGLTKRFGRVRAVDGLDFQVRCGDVYGFLGPNGAGKSTTIRMMVGLIRPTSGKVTLFGRDIVRDVGPLYKVGALVETPAFYRYLSGRQNLQMLSRSPAKRAEIDSALEEVGLLQRANDKVKAYSHGMRQRLGLALAMLKEPELMILDEPTSGLDPQGMKEIRNIIRKLAEQRGVTIFLSSHLLHEVEQICDKVGIVSQGKLVAQGNVQEMMDAAGDASIEIDRPDEAAEAILPLDYVDSVLTVGDQLHVKVIDGRLAELNAFLVGKGFQVSALVPRRRTLEEVYLAAIENEAIEPVASESHASISTGRR